MKVKAKDCKYKEIYYLSRIQMNSSAGNLELMNFNLKVKFIGKDKTGLERDYLRSGCFCPKDDYGPYIFEVEKYRTLRGAPKLGLDSEFILSTKPISKKEIKNIPLHDIEVKHSLDRILTTFTKVEVVAKNQEQVARAFELLKEDYKERYPRERFYLDFHKKNDFGEGFGEKVFDKENKDKYKKFGLEIITVIFDRVGAENPTIEIRTDNIRYKNRKDLNFPILELSHDLTHEEIKSKLIEYANSL